MVRFVYRPKPSITNDLHVSVATPPRLLQTLRFSSLVHHLSGPEKTKKTHNTYTYTHTHIYIIHTKKHKNTHLHAHIHIYIHVIMNHQRHNHSWTGSVMCLCCVYVVCVCLSAVYLHLINTCMKTSHSTCTCADTLFVIEPRTHKKSNCFFLK